MTGLNNIRTAIVDTLQTVPGIGQVHGYMRHDQGRQDRAKALFYHDGRVNVWFVRRSTTKETEDTSSYNKVVHSWDIRGYLQQDDEAASELAFDDLVEMARNAFRFDEHLTETIDTTVFDDQAGLQLVDNGPVMFFGVLCHSARLNLKTETKQDLVAADDNEGSFAVANVRYDLAPADGSIDAEDSVMMETD